MYAIVPDSATHHVDNIARNWGFDVRGAAIWEVTGHDTNRAAVHQWFSDVAVIKDDGSVHGWDAGFISTDSNTSMDPAKNARGVEEVLWQLSFPIRWPKAENIGVGNGAGAQARSQNIPVHANDAGHGPSIGVQGGGRIVGLCFHADAPRVVPCDDA